MDVHKRHGTGDSNVDFFTKKNTPQKLNIFAPLVDGPALYQFSWRKKFHYFGGFSIGLRS